MIFSDFKRELKISSVGKSSFVTSLPSEKIVPLLVIAVPGAIVYFAIFRFLR
jgi:hypothetical protein